MQATDAKPQTKILQ